MPLTYWFRRIGRSKPSAFNPNPGQWQPAGEAYDPDPDAEPEFEDPVGMTPEDFEFNTVRIACEVVTTE